MTHHDFTVKPWTDPETITFGRSEKTVTIDITFIPASRAYHMMKLLSKDPETGKYPATVYAQILALFTQDVDAEWIAENVGYPELDEIVSLLIKKAFERSGDTNFQTSSST